MFQSKVGNLHFSPVVKAAIIIRTNYSVRTNANRTYTLGETWCLFLLKRKMCGNSNNEKRRHWTPEHLFFYLSALIAKLISLNTSQMHIGDAFPYAQCFWSLFLRGQSRQHFKKWWQTVYSSINLNSDHISEFSPCNMIAFVIRNMSIKMSNCIITKVMVCVPNSYTSYGKEHRYASNLIWASNSRSKSSRSNQSIVSEKPKALLA